MKSGIVGFKAAVVAAGLWAVFGAASAASVITFEGVAPPGDQTTEDGSNTVFSGFNVFVPHGHYQSNGFDFPNRPVNGTDWLLHDHFNGTLNQPVVVTKVGGGSFSAQSIDASEWDASLLRGQTLTLTGHLSGGGTIVQQFTTDDVFAFETFTLSGFGDITQLDILGSTTGVNFGTLGYDNIVLDDPVTGVPVPAPLALAALGLALLGAQRSRRSRR